MMNKNFLLLSGMTYKVTVIFYLGWKEWQEDTWKKVP